METELLNLIILEHLNRCEFVSNDINRYLRFYWESFEMRHQQQLIKLIGDWIIKDDFDYDVINVYELINWSHLHDWMLSNAKTNDITWDASK
jgi:hypothetical protein